MRSLRQVGTTAESFALHAPRMTFVLALLALALATAWSPMPQEREITAAGQVTHGTPGGIIPSDLDISLHIFSGMEEKEARTTTLADDGAFRFDNLALEEGDTCVARVVYLDVTYVSNFVIFESGQQKVELAVTIYDTTEDPSTIQVTQMHAFVSLVNDRVQIEEYYLIGNTGDRTYIGQEAPEEERRVTLFHTLPDGAEDLSFDGSGLGERYLEREGGFVDTEPVIPGNMTVETSFSYVLAYREGVQIRRVFSAPVQSVVMLLTGDEWELEGPGIISGDPIDTQMGAVFSYLAGPLAVGEPLVFALVARPQSAMPPVSSAPTSSTPVRNTARETSVGLVALAVAVVVVYLLWRPSTSELLPASGRPLVQAMAALDKDFEAGRISEESYRQKRKTLKEQLCTLLKSVSDNIRN
jgi:hypothetical protein